MIKTSFKFHIMCITVGHGKANRHLFGTVPNIFEVKTEGGVKCYVLKSTIFLLPGLLIFNLDPSR